MRSQETSAAHRLRIGVGGISLESNDFVPFTAELSDFVDAGFLVEGDEIFSLAASTAEIGGALARLAREPDVEIVPLLAARGVSSGRLSEPTWSRLREGLLGRVRAALPLDAVYLFHHGSMEAVGEDDPEGAIEEAVRELVGVATAIVVTCDLHANVTRRMVENADAILGYEHYPHDDVYDTGERGADLLLRIVRGDASPRMAQAKLASLILTALNSTTLTDTPYAQLMRAAKELEADPAILSASVFLVGSYIDSPDMGCSTVVVANGDSDRAAVEAERLARDFWERRFSFEVDMVSVAEAVERGRAIEGGPILLLDTSDTTGGGAAGDCIGVVRDLLEARVEESSLAMVVDPRAAAACHEAGEGAELDLVVGHRRDPRWGEPLEVHAHVEKLSDGTFRYDGGILGGVQVSMGPSAVVAIGPIRLLVMSIPTYDWGDDQYRSIGLDPAAAKFVTVKNMMNFRFGYANVMKDYFVLDLPGPTPPDMRLLPFEKIVRPVFPLDRDAADPRIEIAHSRPRPVEGT